MRIDGTFLLSVKAKVGAHINDDLTDEVLVWQPLLAQVDVRDMSSLCETRRDVVLIRWNDGIQDLICRQR